VGSWSGHKGDVLLQEVVEVEEPARLRHGPQLQTHQLRLERTLSCGVRPTPHSAHDAGLTTSESMEVIVRDTLQRDPGFEDAWDRGTYQPAEYGDSDSSRFASRSPV
jgi:hypothetical protein